MAEPLMVAVLRNTQDGTCYLAPVEEPNEFDLDTLDEAGFELAGFLGHAEEYNPSSRGSFSEEFAEDTGDLEDDDGKTIYQGPTFTTCMHEGCPKLIACNEFGGAEYCADHEKDDRLEYLRGELRGGRLSYGELAELQSLSKYIKAGDVELLEAAGVEEQL